MIRPVLTYWLHIDNAEQVTLERYDLNGIPLPRHTGQLGLDATQREQIGWLLSDAETSNVSDQPEALHRLGTLLFDALMDANLRRVFYADYAYVRTIPEGYLRFVLNIDEDTLPDIAALPWEFACAGGGHDPDIWLATNTHLVLVRFRRVAHSRKQNFFANRLQVLLAGATLRDEDKPDIRFQDVRAPLETLAAANAVLDLTQPLEKAELAAVRSALAAHLHIFHLVAHASFGGASGLAGTVFLVNPMGYSAPVTAREFATVFETHPPDVVLLQMCEGAMSDPQRSFSDIAAPVMMQSVPIVIAMQFKITVESAAAFARVFYAALLQGADVEYAVQTARGAVVDKTGSHELRDYATPVVYTSLETPLSYRFLGAPTIDNAFIIEHFDGAVLRVIRHDPPTVEKQDMLRSEILVEAKYVPTPNEWADAFRNLTSTHRREIAARAGLERRESAELLAVRDDQQLVRFIQSCDRMGKLDDLRQALARVVPSRCLKDIQQVRGYITIAPVKPDAQSAENDDIQVVRGDWLVSLHLNR